MTIINPNLVCWFLKSWTALSTFSPLKLSYTTLREKNTKTNISQYNNYHSFFISIHINFLWNFIHFPYLFIHPFTVHSPSHWNRGGGISFPNHTWSGDSPLWGRPAFTQTQIPPPTKKKERVKQPPLAK